MIPGMQKTDGDGEHPCTNVYTTHILSAYFQTALFMQLSANPACLFIFVLRGNREESSAYSARAHQRVPSQLGRVLHSSLAHKQRSKWGCVGPGLAPQQQACGGTCWDPPFTAHTRWTYFCSPGSEPWNNIETLKRKSISHQVYWGHIPISEHIAPHTALWTKRGGVKKKRPAKVNWQTKGYPASRL